MRNLKTAYQKTKESPKGKSGNLLSTQSCFKEPDLVLSTALGTETSQGFKRLLKTNEFISGWRPEEPMVLEKSQETDGPDELDRTCGQNQRMSKFCSPQSSNHTTENEWTRKEAASQPQLDKINVLWELSWFVTDVIDFMVVTICCGAASTPFVGGAMSFCQLSEHVRSKKGF